LYVAGGEVRLKLIRSSHCNAVLVEKLASLPNFIFRGLLMGGFYGSYTSAREALKPYSQRAQLWRAFAYGRHLLNSNRRLYRWKLV
jgi:hypothetical protein